MSAAAGYQWASVSRAHCNPDAITLLKAWGSVGDAGPALGSLVKRLLVKLNRRLWFKPPPPSLSSSASLCFFSSPYLISFLLHCPFPHPPPLHLFLHSSSLSFVFIEHLFLPWTTLHKWMCLSMFFPARIFSLSSSAVNFHYFFLPSDLHLPCLINLFSPAAPTLILLYKHFFYADGLCCDFHWFLNVLIDCKQICSRFLMEFFWHFP